MSLKNPLYLANSGVKGPVWLDIPLDLQSAQINPEELRGFEPEEVINEPIERCQFY